MLSTGGEVGEGEGEGEGEEEGEGVGVTTTSTTDVVSNIPTDEEMVATGVGLLVRSILEASEAGMTLVVGAISDDGGLLDGEIGELEGTSIIVVTSIAKHE